MLNKKSVLRVKRRDSGTISGTRNCVNYYLIILNDNLPRAFLKAR